MFGKTAKELFFIAIGCLIEAVGAKQLTMPAHLMFSGVTGIGMLLQHILPFFVAIGVITLLLNIPLLIAGYWLVGKKFAIYSGISVVLLSLMLDLIPFRVWTTDHLLSAIFGGLMSGVGGALVLRFGGSTGLDILARIVAEHKNISIGRFSLVMDGAIILAAAYLFDLETAMYTLVSIFVGAKTYDVLLNHMGRITVMIITDKGDKMAEQIIRSMRRGVTKWEASGAYTNSGKQVLMCVIVNVQFSELEEIVYSVDQQAFLAVLPTQQVVGRFAAVQ